MRRLNIFHWTNDAFERMVHSKTERILMQHFIAAKVGKSDVNVLTPKYVSLRSKFVLVEAFERGFFVYLNCSYMFAGFILTICGITLYGYPV